MKPRDDTKPTSIDRALDHFDDFYKSVYGPKWPGIRAAMLTENKFAALINNYGEPGKSCETMELNGAINVRKVFEIFYNELPDDTIHVKENVRKQTSIDRKLNQIVQEKQTTELRSVYQHHAEEELEKIRLETSKDPSRVIDVEDVVNYKKSLQQSLAEDAEYDRSRMISAEIGLMGLQEFIPATKLKGMEDFIPESDHYQYYKTSLDFPLKFEHETSFKFPETLNMYIYPKCDISRFPRPKPCTTKVLSHFLCDGASILPPLMLNIKPDDLVLDACSAPGGKSLVMLQSFLPKVVVCNDKQRPHRVERMFRQYFPDFNTKWDGERCVIQGHDIRDVQEFSKYDKVSQNSSNKTTFTFSFSFQILVDVPCSNDRHSVTQNENNLFRGDRIKERLQIPELQASILVHCLQLLKPGGSLVYSTCSLSPIQNDGVVSMALSKAFKELHITTTIK